MKKKYIKAEMQVIKIGTTAMLADSLNFDDTVTPSSSTTLSRRGYFDDEGDEE